MNTDVGGEYSADERIGPCQRPWGRNFCLGGKQKERLGLRKVLEMINFSRLLYIWWKDIRQRLLADILWVVVQEDTNETFPDLRQKCRRHPRGLPLLGQFDSKWSKLLKLRKVFNHFYKIVLFPGSNLLLWENWMKMILLNLWKGKTKKWEILFGESSKSILSRCLRYSARLRRSQRRRKTWRALPGTWDRRWLQPNFNQSCRGSREGGWRSW